MNLDQTDKLRTLLRDEALFIQCYHDTKYPDLKERYLSAAKDCRNEIDKQPWATESWRLIINEIKEAI